MHALVTPMIIPMHVHDFMYGFPPAPACHHAVAIASRSDEKGQRSESVFWVSFVVRRFARSFHRSFASRQQFGMHNNNVVM